MPGYLYEYSCFKKELRYAKAAAYLAKHPDDKDSTQKELQEEQEMLLSEIDVYKRQGIHGDNLLVNVRNILLTLFDNLWFKGGLSILWYFDFHRTIPRCV